MKRSDGPSLVDESRIGATERAGVSRDEVRPVTALFADIVGSTALGEFLAMEEVKALVGECVTRMCEVIEGYGGEVGAYMGDGVAAFFGLERAGEDDQVRASLAALELQKVVAEFAQEARSAWGVESLNVRVGINCGRVATGAVGGNNPRVLALGDAVNVAARLQSIAEPGTIAISEAVADALAGRFELRPLGTLELKGRTAKVAAFRLESTAERSELRPLGPMIGREPEMSRLEEFLIDLSTGRGRVIVVLGEAGIGKTRLIEEMRQRVPSGVLWLTARGDELETRLPYAPFVEVLRTWLGLGVGAADLAIRVRVKARLQELLGEEAEEFVAPLTRLLGVRPRTKADRRLDGLPVDVLSASLHRAYKTWLRALARSVPVVLAIDNFGRVDDSSADLAEELLSVTDAAPLVVTFVMRSDPGTASWRVRVKALAEYAHRTEEMRLESISDAKSQELVNSLDPERVLTARVRSAVVRKAEGNPLYLEELINAITGRDSDLEAVEHDQLPRALEGILLSRIDSLPASARETAQAAAILGREFSKEVLARMIDGAAVEDLIGTLLRAHIIREHRRGSVDYAFKHGMLREAALATLTHQRRRELHSRAADAFEACGAADSRDRVDELAWHHMRSGNVAKAVEFLEYLGERLASLYKFGQAVEVLEGCREKLRGSARDGGYERVTRRLAELRSRTGDAQAACELLDELLLGVAEGDVVRNELLVLKAQVLSDAGAFMESSELLNICLRSVGIGHLRSRALVMSAHIALRSQDFLVARECLERLDDVETLDVELGFEVAALWAGYLAAEGDFVAGRTWAERATGLAAQLGKASQEMRAKRQLGILSLLNGRVSAARSLLGEVFEDCLRLEFVVGAFESGVNLVHALYQLGELEEAKIASDRMLSLASNPFWEALIRSNLATIEFERNELIDAEVDAMRVLSMGVQITSPAPRIAAHGALARVHAARGRWNDAEKELREADEEAARMGGRQGLRSSIRASIGELKSQQGEWEQALQLAEEALVDMQFVEKPVQVAVLRLKGTALCGVAPERARATLVEAQGMCRVMGMRLEEARTLIALSVCSPNEAEPFLKEAELIFRECGCARGLVEIDEARRHITRS